MKDQPKVHSDRIYSPTAALEAAVAKLDALTKAGVTHFDIEQDGRVIVKCASPLEKVVDLARSFLGSIVKSKADLKETEKISRIKQEILRARDFIQSHSLLIKKLEQGDSTQKELAHWAHQVIHRYNTVVAQKPSTQSLGQIYDEEMRGTQIVLPNTVSIKFDSHAGLFNHPAFKTIQGLSHTLSEPTSKKYASSPTKLEQVMENAFAMKARRMFDTHLPAGSSMSEMMTLVHETPIEIQEGLQDFILMGQTIEIAPGYKILLRGAYKKPTTDSNLRIPGFETFGLTYESVQTGFPYPGQHTSWALADTCVDISPLRAEKNPLFSRLDKQKKQLAQELLHEAAPLARAKEMFAANKAAFDAKPSFFIGLHWQLHELILKQSGAPINDDSEKILNEFYSEVSAAASPFSYLGTIQQRLLYLFLISPSKKLYEEWLEGKTLSLRSGTQEERRQAAMTILEEQMEAALNQLNRNLPAEAFIGLFGPLLGKAAQTLVLQYMSEKIEFAPPSLNQFEKKVQKMAFAQVMAFLEEWNEDKEMNVAEKLEQKMKRDISILQGEKGDKLALSSLDICNELQIYVESRFKTSKV